MSGLIESSIDPILPESLKALDQVKASGPPASHGFSAVVWYISFIVYRILEFFMYYVPSYVLGLLGRRFSITLKFSSLLLLIIILIGIIWAVIRYRYLTLYSRLPPEPHRQEPEVDIFVDGTGPRRSKSGFSSYLDDFLSAIKIFGYLDRPVFHELTRNMQTSKLEAGETLVLQDDKGFSIVVDGMVQIYVKSGTDSKISSSVPEKDVFIVDGQRYQLLNEVHRGAPMSSLFSILSLFTGDVELSENLRSDANNSINSTDLDIPEFSLGSVSRGSSVNGTNYDGINGNGNVNVNVNGGVSNGGAGNFETFNDPFSSQRTPPTPQLIARASVDSTVAIIPQEAFRRVTRKFPKAASHIVQVILTRCQRVTFQTAHHYLGMTQEIFETEIRLNERANYDLPDYLRQRAVSRLKDSILDEGHVVSLETPKKHIRKQAKTPTVNNAGAKSRSRQVVLEPNLAHPGDLLSSVPLSRRQSTFSMTPQKSNLGPNTLSDIGIQVSDTKIEITASPFSSVFSLDDESEDSTLRIALTECMFKGLGIDQEVKRTPGKSVTPLEASPLFPADSFSSSHKLFSNLSLDAVPDDESVASSATPSNDSAQVAAAEFLEVQFYKKGSILNAQNEPGTGLYYVIDGVLEIGYNDNTGAYRELYTVKPGGLAGFISTILTYRSFADIKAKTDVYLGYLPRSSWERIIEKYPSLMLRVSKTLTSVLTSLIHNLDFALEWVQVQAGEVIFNQDEDADDIFIVLNGRLRSVQEQLDSRDTTTRKVLAEYGHGESIGELEVLTASKRPCSLVAIRDSELARFPRTLFENLANQHPYITIEISRLVASRVRNLMNSSNSLDSPSTEFHTVSVIPITAGLPVTEFAKKLTTAFVDTDRHVITLNMASVLSQLGRNAFNKIGQLKLAGYLADLEEQYQTVLYVADTNVNSPWTRACISQADCILLLADATAQPDIGEFERLLVTMKTTARTELILLHPDRHVSPGSTSNWLANRIWVHSHHHIQMAVSPRSGGLPGGIMGQGSRLRKIRDKVQLLQSEIVAKYRSRGLPIYNSNLVHKNDFNRLARILSGNAVGLVLGGGGARGIAHIGVIRALEENGIPIDYVGGTSIGAFVGGLYAKEYDLVPIYGRAKKFASRISSLWRMVFDLTYPATSYTTGHEFNRGIWKTFGDSRIEDFWLKFYTNTTNITHSRMEIHRSGYSWRYIRASMSLAGLLPPLTDNGSMLLDGGYVDNLPVREMKRLGAKVIFAVDVGSIDDTTPMEYGDTLSGLWVIFNRWNIFSRHPNVPNLAEIQQRLAYVSSVGALEAAKATPGVYYIRPPVDDFATLDFGKFDDIYRVGSTHSHDLLETWKSQGKYPVIAGASASKGGSRRSMVRRNSI